MNKCDYALNIPLITRLNYLLHNTLSAWWLPATKTASVSTELCSCWVWSSLHVTLWLWLLLLIICLSTFLLFNSVGPINITVWCMSNMKDFGYLSASLWLPHVPASTKKTLFSFPYNHRRELHFLPQGKYHLLHCSVLIQNHRVTERKLVTWESYPCWWEHGI